METWEREMRGAEADQKRLEKAFADHRIDAITYAYASIWTDEKHVAQVRADTPDHFVHDFLTHLHTEVQRKRYREEREHPEFVDLGGEA